MEPQYREKRTDGQEESSELTLGSQPPRQGLEKGLRGGKRTGPKRDEKKKSDTRDRQTKNPEE
jgi:hypothetical protein